MTSSSDAKELPRWARDHITAGTDPDDEAIAWMRSRPESVKALMRRFPPSCIVRATRALVCPPPGSYGVVVSYLEAGTIRVTSPDSEASAECRPEWIEVVATVPPMDASWVEWVLGDAD